MLQKEELVSYRRFNRLPKNMAFKEMSYFSLQHIILYLSVFLAARVFMFNALMPFGISILIAVFGVYDKKTSFISAVFAAAGYICTFNYYISINHAITILLLMFFILVVNENDKNRIVKMCAAAFIINSSVNMFFHIKYISMGFTAYDLALCIIESVIAAASSFIFFYAMPLYFETRKRKILSKEEMICAGLLLAIILSGMWDIKYYGFSLRNMVAFFFVLTAGYIEGPSMGAALGVSFGLISSISDSTMPVLIGLYAFCGMIGGIFRGSGKIISGLSFIISAVLISFYTSASLNVKTIYFDTFLPVIIFIIIPEMKYKRLALFIDGDKRVIELQKSYIERVKDIMGIRLDEISGTLSALCDILKENVDSELSQKSEINGVVEKLADRACFSCDGRGLCWKKDFYNTYDSFIELLRKIERTGKIYINELPGSLDKKCIRPNELIKQANNIYELFRLNNKWKRKLINSRNIVGEQLMGISQVIKSMMDEVAVSVEFRNDIEEEISVALDRKGLDFDDILAVKNNRSKYEITIYRKPCSGQQICSRDYSSAVSKTLGVKMVRECSSCKFNDDNTLCQFRLVETEKYSAVTAVAKYSVEEISGDNYSFGNIRSGGYMTALSDGMGSGIRAAIESNTTVTLLEKFMEAGYDRSTAIKAINSVLIFRSCDENYATIDLNIIDLYNGIAEFVKIGSAPSYVKSGESINIINSTNIPAGILDDINIESDIVNVKNGDMIVMVSDGVIESNKDLKEKWIARALREYDSGNPKEVAEYILNKAKQYYGDKILDDMTVIATKIWKVQ